MGNRASPSILSKGFFWFLFCFQREVQEVHEFKGSRVQRFKSLKVHGFNFVLSVLSVVKAKCSLHGHLFLLACSHLFLKPFV